MVEVRPLTYEALMPLIKLDVRPDQSDMVAPNAITMAQSIFEHGSEIFGIFDGDKPVGLLAIIDLTHPEADLDPGDDPDTIYVWRLMVDAAHQRKGFGTAGLDHAMAIARDRGRARLAISAVPDDGSAIPVYEKYGFQRTGRIVEGEVELAFPLADVG